MRFKLLGNSGLRVSEICLGSMTLSLNNPWDWGVNKEISLEILRKYTELGGNFIDTSVNYTDGESEKVIGEYIKDDRDRYVIATKFTLHNHEYPDDPNFGGNGRKNLFRSLKNSLKNLQTDYVDLLYLHVWDYTTPIEEIMKSLEIAIQSGKVNYVAISDTPAWVVSQANKYAELRGLSRFIAYQFPYNLMRRDAEREVIPYCKYNDLAMIPWSVLGSGLFTGKYTREKGQGRLKTISDRNLEISKKVDEIADELNCKSSQVAINWVKNQDQQIIPIIGATKETHIDEAINALEIRLTEGQMKRIDEIVNFDIGFPQNFLGAQNVLNLIHGKTYDNLENHRFRGF
ncbi:MAG: aldo/keto reductase [Candidatus Thorarchaeota archaeon]